MGFAVTISSPVVIGRRRAVEVLSLRRVAPLQLDAVGPRWTRLRHHHAQQRVVGHVVRRSVLDALRRHDVLAVTNGQLPLPFPGVVGLPHALLVSAASSAAILVPRPVRLCVAEGSELERIARSGRTNKVHRM